MGGMKRKAPIKAHGAMHGSYRANKICSPDSDPDSSARKRP